MNRQTTLLVVALLTTASLQQSHAGSSSRASKPPMQMKADAGATKASATGIVKTVDVAAGTMTISEDPVPALNWPAMVMTFKATSAQLASVHAGQKVAFEFTSKGMDGTLTRIGPAK